MKVLFVSKENKEGGISSITFNQGESLRNLGLSIDYFTVRGSGFLGYLSNIPKLREKIKLGNYDLIHSHYSFCGYLTAIASRKKKVVSLMGSDLLNKKSSAYMIRFFALFFWKKVIVKSEEMYDRLACKNAVVIPNGVDLHFFRPINRQEALEKVGWKPEKKHVLFAADPMRSEKNYELAKKAWQCLDDDSIELHTLGKVPYELMPYYYNSSDAILLTSLREGSPNVIKEAMACNRPTICTPVGDVQKVMGKTNCCFIVPFDFKEIASKIKLAIKCMDGDARLAVHHLSRSAIAKSVEELYREVINE